MDPSGIFLLKVDLVAAGTRVRIGRGIDEFASVETLSLGDEIYDPIVGRLVEITEMACVTLDADTIRDRGFSPKKLGDDPAAMIYAVKVPNTALRRDKVPPIRGEYELPQSVVFFAIGLEREATVETAVCYCEFVRPSNYAIDNIPKRRAPLGRDDILSSLGH